MSSIQRIDMLIIFYEHALRIIKPVKYENTIQYSAMPSPLNVLIVE